MTKPNICVLKTDGINCDEEMAHAFAVTGAKPEIIHVNELRNGTKRLNNFGALAIPGGFSYGDDIASGRVLATELTSYLADDLREFIADEKPIVGICNGDQVLVKTGLLPFGTLGEQGATLIDNEIGRFECRWIDLKVGRSVCKFVQPEDFEDNPVPMQTAHAEGRFFADPQQIIRLHEYGQVVFQYVTPQGAKPEGYPENPNGSIDDIAGVCDPSGLILGMMPHPERSIEAFHPYRVRTESARQAALTIFKNIVKFTKE
jgi:phosphoribosylformylglycinamidine synthase